MQEESKFLNVEAPAQWAQSLEQVFIEVRYAHRHDSPGCSQVEDETVVIEEDFVQVYVVCIQGTQKIRYIWSVVLNAPINVEKSFSKHQAVGRHHITLEKVHQPDRWRFLHSEEDVRPSQLRIWKDKHQKHLEKVWEHFDPPSADWEGHEWKEAEEEDY